MKKFVFVLVFCFIVLDIAVSGDNVLFEVGVWADIKEPRSSTVGLLYPKIEIIVPIIDDFVFSKFGTFFYDDIFIGTELQVKKDIIRNFLAFAVGGGVTFNVNKLELMSNALFSTFVKISNRLFLDFSLLLEFNKDASLGVNLCF